MHTIDVAILHGKIRDARTAGVNLFKSVAYAGQISGDRRFRRPAALDLWFGSRDAAIQNGANLAQKFAAHSG